MKETKLFELVTGTEMKPWLSRNMLKNINTCENAWSNFSANLRVVSLKLLELTQYAWPNLSIYFNFWCAVPLDDVIESTRFMMRPPVIIPPWLLMLPNGPLPVAVDSRQLRTMTRQLPGGYEPQTMATLTPNLLKPQNYSNLKLTQTSNLLKYQTMTTQTSNLLKPQTNSNHKPTQTSNQLKPQTYSNLKSTQTPNLLKPQIYSNLKP